MGVHLIDGEFQSDKYPTTPRGKVPLSVKDPMAQDLLREYARRRRALDAEFADDLEEALRLAGYADVAVTEASAPALWRAFREIEIDNGGHLVGTVYPGEKVEMETFTVPAQWASLVVAAEAGLARLLAGDALAFHDFVCGEIRDQEEIHKRQGDLEEAHHLLDRYFNGWTSEAGT